MTLGQHLRPHVDAWIQSQESDQNGLAMTWLEQWNARNSKAKLASTTVGPKLTRLLKDDDEGVRFFFRDRARGALLLEILGVEGEEHDTLMSLASTQLNGELPARMVIEMGELPANRDVCDVVFAELERLLRVHRSMLPATLVLTHDQYRYLPRSYDDFGDQLRWERADDADGCAKLALGLAKDDVLLVSTRALGCPYFRWAGIGVYATKDLQDTADDDELHRDSGLRFRLDPPDALEVFASVGRLPDLPPVQHTLAELGVEAGHNGLPWDPRDGAFRREIMRLLADEERVAIWAKDGWEPMHRQSWAEHLGVPAASSAEERAEHELSLVVSGLGLPVEQGDLAELRARVERAKRRPTPPSSLRVGSQVHAINPPVEPPAHPRLKVWRLSCAEPAITRIRQAVAGWTEEDLVLDRDLSGLVRRLDPDEQEASSFLHARATLLHGDWLELADRASVADWKGALGTLLALEPPTPRLRLYLRREKEPYGPDAQRAPFLALLTAGKLPQNPGQTPVLTFLPSLGPLEIGPQDTPGVVTPAWRRNDWDSTKEEPDTSVLVPRPGAKAPDADAWLDAMDGSTGLGGALPAELEQLLAKAREEEEERRRRGFGYYGRNQDYGQLFAEAMKTYLRAYLRWGPEGPRWNVVPVEIPPDTWSEANRLLPVLWVLLRRGLRRDEGVRMPDGELLLPLGGPLAATVSVEQASTAEAPPRAVLCVDVAQDPTRSRAETIVPALKALNLSQDTTPSQPDSNVVVPSELLLVGRGIVARFNFVASALLGVESRWH